MQTLKTRVFDALSRAADTVLPPRCVVTGELVERQGMISPKAWADLDFITDPFCAVCGFPFEFEAGAGSQCTDCLADRPLFETARAALKYNDASRAMILGFKHGDQTHNVKAFMPWLKRAGEGMIAGADLLMPVPLHRWRLISRRYNQSMMIAAALSKEIGKPVMADGLIRTRPTPPQGHLNASERQKNVKRAFAINPLRTHAIKDKTIILIDDVYTTGATVRECTKELLKGGAAAVHVLALARVARAGFG